MFANQYHLDNLVAIVDNNGLQIDGKISEVWLSRADSGKVRGIRLARDPDGCT